MADIDRTAAELEVVEGVEPTREGVRSRARELAASLGGRITMIAGAVGVVALAHVEPAQAQQTNLDDPFAVASNETPEDPFAVPAEPKPSLTSIASDTAADIALDDLDSITDAYDKFISTGEMNDVMRSRFNDLVQRYNSGEIDPDSPRGLKIGEIILNRNLLALIS